MPPFALFARQPPISFVSPSAVTYFGLPSTIARPLRWQRSDGSSSVTNGGRQRGVKLASGSSVARQEKRVLTNQSSLAGAVGHLVDQDVAGDVAGARQKAGVVAAGGLQASGDIGNVAELPDLDGGADGEPGTASG